MSSTTDKMKGHADDAAGAVKKNVGKAMGDDRMEAEGAGQQAAGKAEVGVGKVKDAVKKAVDKI